MDSTIKGQDEKIQPHFNLKMQRISRRFFEDYVAHSTRPTQKNDSLSEAVFCVNIILSPINGSLLHQLAFCIDGEFCTNRSNFRFYMSNHYFVAFAVQNVSNPACQITCFSLAKASCGDCWCTDTDTRSHEW